MLKLCFHLVIFQGKLGGHKKHLTSWCTSAVLHIHKLCRKINLSFVTTDVDLRSEVPVAIAPVLLSPFSFSLPLSISSFFLPFPPFHFFQLKKLCPRKHRISLNNRKGLTLLNMLIVCISYNPCKKKTLCWLLTWAKHLKYLIYYRCSAGSLGNCDPFCFALGNVIKSKKQLV